MATWLTSEEAAARLGVSRTTLYAYVSRGLVRSTPEPGNPHARRYAREDVERLRDRAEQRRNPGRAAERALHWGTPLLESAITLVSGNRLYYRGHDVCDLAITRSIREVASLIWLGSFENDFAVEGEGMAATAPGHDTELPFTARAQSLLPLAAAADPLAFDLRPKAVAQTGWRILNLLALVAANTATAGAAIDETLRREWAPRTKDAAALLRAALILSADHELNVSSFTARCVASAAANPYMVVLGGLAAIEGSKHGGTSARIERLFDELRAAGNLKRAVAERLRRGETLYGFGHPLYEEGDPRAKLLLELLAKSQPNSPAVQLALDIAEAASHVLNGEKPTVDFALVALARALGLPPGAPLTLFALGRTIGWIGHAMEQYAKDEIIRPRARYVGTLP